MNAVFAAGPLGFAIEGARAPADWPCARASGSAPQHLIRVTLTAAAPSVGSKWDGALDGIQTGVAPTTGICTFTRRGAFDATFDPHTLCGAYRGLVDGTADAAVPTPMPLVESFLRACAATTLLLHGGALFHGASVAVDGAGYLFCGLSGAGKTTLVEGTIDGVYLSDDQSIMGLQDGEPCLWGSPFSGLAARRAAPVCVPLRAVVLLSSTRPARTRLTIRTDRARASGELLRHVCSFLRTPHEAERALAMVANLVTQVPLFSLERHLDTSLMDVVDAIRARAPAVAPAVDVMRRVG